MQVPSKEGLGRRIFLGLLIHRGTLGAIQLPYSVRIDGAAKVNQAQVHAGLPFSPSRLQEQVFWLHVPAITDTQPSSRTPQSPCFFTLAMLIIL